MHERDTMTPAEWERLTRYLAGDMSSDERATVDHWIDAEPGRSDEIHELKRRWQASALPTDTLASAVAWEDVQARLQLGRDTRTTQPGSRRTGVPVSVFSRGSIGHFPKLGAAALLCGVLAAIGTRILHSVNAPRAQYATGVGEQAIVTLTDGSRVVLAPETTVGIDRGFGATMRNVAVNGEAYFDVRTATETPFIVRTVSATTRVLGTAFSVRHYAEDTRTQVAVVHGRVAVHLAHTMHAPITVAAGTALVVNDSISTVVRLDSSAPYPLWTRSTLAFRDAPVSEVLAALTRCYGLRFRLADSTLASQNLTMWLTTQSSAKALADLKLLLDVDLTFKGDTIAVRRRAPGLQPMRYKQDTRELSNLPLTGTGRE